MTEKQIFEIAYKITEQFMSLDSCDPGANESMVPQRVQDIIRDIITETHRNGIVEMLDASVKEVRRRCLAISRIGLERVAKELLKRSRDD